MKQCFKCKLDVIESKKLAKCSKCGKNFHVSCTRSVNVWKKQRSNYKAMWKCDHCHAKLSSKSPRKNEGDNQLETLKENRPSSKSDFPNNQILDVVTNLRQELISFFTSKLESLNADKLENQVNSDVIRNEKNLTSKELAPEFEDIDTKESMEKYCRLCLKFDYWERPVPILRSELKSMIKDVLGVEINPDDKLPNVLCHLCLAKLEFFSTFKKQVKDSRQFLRDFGLESARNRSLHEPPILHHFASSTQSSPKVLQLNNSKEENEEHKTLDEQKSKKRLGQIKSCPSCSFKTRNPGVYKKHQKVHRITPSVSEKGEGGKENEKEKGKEEKGKEKETGKEQPKSPAETSEEENGKEDDEEAEKVSKVGSPLLSTYFPCSFCDKTLIASREELIKHKFKAHGIKDGACQTSASSSKSAESNSTASECSKAEKRPAPKKLNPRNLFSVPYAAILLDSSDSDETIKQAPRKRIRKTVRSSDSDDDSDDKNNKNDDSAKKQDSNNRQQLFDNHRGEHQQQQNQHQSSASDVSDSEINNLIETHVQSVVSSISCSKRLENNSGRTSSKESIEQVGEPTTSRDTQARESTSTCETDCESITVAPKFVCSICYKLFTTVTLLVAHKRTHQ